MTCILSCHWSLCVYLPFSPGRAPQSPPSNVYKRGGGLGGLLGFGWVGASKPQNPPAPYKHSLYRRWGGYATTHPPPLGTPPPTPTVNNEEQPTWAWGVQNSSPHFPHPPSPSLPPPQFVVNGKRRFPPRTCAYSECADRNREFKKCTPKPAKNFRPLPPPPQKYQSAHSPSPCAPPAHAAGFGVRH